MIEYSYPLYRPPAEADNIIIQATYGCSYNNCTFCSMYKTKSFEVRAIEDVFNDVETLAHSYPDARKVFLADGDALALDTEYLLKLLKHLKQSFVKLRRVSLYASAQNILNKSTQDLQLLRENGLNLIYYGVETGSDIVLKKITKGVNQSEIIESLNKASDAGLKISATVILGMGGTKYSDEHIIESSKIINATRINYLSTLQLGLEEDAKEKFYKHFKDFEMLGDIELLQEQKKFIQLLNPTNKIIFRSNHASNALHLAGNLPREKERLIQELDNALSVGEMAFIPSMFRGF
ncbi:radical SAM protein [Sulfurimonas sp.]|uniref:radical SAM protein n=1 Tax=Sulfurimonas sp. TaxID=2022749 RepID=UPI0025ECC566|nr:radical SAM protein [Sulfurimonas sp.]